MSDTPDLNAQLVVERDGAVLATMGSRDQREGMRAFLEKRPPRFNQSG
jgi:enoyl-CoA hydratase/carnithine racemase